MIGFLSDFGHADPYVGICHGVIAGFAPDERVVDICHEVPRGDVRTGAAMLAQAVPYLYDGVYVAVVDPGVGTGRRGVVISAGHSMFVGPDNGLLLWGVNVLGGPAEAYEITNHHLMITPVSYTFHGRDVFSPVAARLATGTPPTAVGPRIAAEELVRLPDPVVGWMRMGYRAKVIGIDRYGNVQTAATATQLRSALQVRTAGSRFSSAPSRRNTARPSAASRWAKWSCSRTLRVPSRSPSMAVTPARFCARKRTHYSTFPG